MENLLKRKMELSPRNKKSSMDSLLKPPKSGLIKKVGPAETGHLTPARSRSASRSSTCSTSNLAPASPSNSGSDPIGNTRPSGITFERSRSSGRLNGENGGGVGSELKGGASASTSVLANISSSSAAGSSGGGIGGQTASKTSLATTCVATASSLSTIQTNGASKSNVAESANARSKGQNPQTSSSTSPSISGPAPEYLEERRKSVKILQQWRKKTSMSKLGKGTRSLVRKPINQICALRCYQIFSIRTFCFRSRSVLQGRAR